MARKTIVLVPGSFSPSFFYTPVAEPLRAAGYTVHVLDPPSYYTKKAGAPPTVYDDAAHISAFVRELVDAGEEVVLLAHSYGGTPASQALLGLTVRERRAKGEKGGVSRVGFITAVVPPVGKNLMEFMATGEQTESIYEADEDGWLKQTRPDLMGSIVFNSLSPEEGAAQAARFGQHSGASFVTPLTHPGYADVAVSWFFCAQDNCVTPTMQQTSIDVIEESWKAAGREDKVDVTRVECDHVPIYSALDELVKWAQELADKEEKE